MAYTKFQKLNKVSHILSPQTVGTGNATSSVISLAPSHAAIFLIDVATLGGNVVFQVYQKNSISSVTKTISGKTTTMGVADSDTLQVLEVDAAELDVQGGFDQIYMYVSAAGTGGYLSVTLIRYDLRYGPASMIT